MSTRGSSISFFLSSRRRHTRWPRDWSSDVCSSDLLSNWIAASRPNRLLVEWLGGIDRRRPLPTFARQTFTDWFNRRAPRLDAPRGSVLLFHDTFVTYNTPEIGRRSEEHTS